MFRGLAAIRWFVALFAGVAALSCAAEVVADRVALVIGNASYADAPLRNPVNDARAMAARLESLGFAVTRLEDASREAMERAIVEFTGRLTEQSTALFYYAGHGVQVRGRNYLVPVGAELASERLVRFEAVDVSAVLDELEFAGSRMNLVILDACRNNPFERRFRGRSRGLAAIDAARGTLIAYATAPGSVAADGEGDNGIYTEELLTALTVPGLTVEEVFKQTRRRVAARTEDLQVPWESSSLTGNFVFNEIDSALGTPTGFSEAALEAMFWGSVKDSGNPAMFQAYLDRYPEGEFAALARLELEAVDAADNDAPSQADRVSSLLAQAAADLDALRLTSPPGNNAVERFREILALDPENTQANLGLSRVVARYVTLADAAIQRGDIEKAAVFLGRAEQVEPRSEAVENLQRRVAALRREGEEASARAEPRAEEEPIRLAEEARRREAEARRAEEEREQARDEVRPGDFPEVLPVLYEHPAFADVPKPRARSVTRKASAWRKTFTEVDEFLDADTVARRIAWRVRVGDGANRDPVSEVAVLGGLLKVFRSIDYPSGDYFHRRLVSVERVEGKLFPLAVGRTLSLKGTIENDQKKNGKPDGEPEWDIEVSFEVVAEGPASKYDLAIGGKVFVIEEVRAEVPEKRTRHYFSQDLAVVVREDHIESGKLLYAQTLTRFRRF